MIISLILKYKMYLMIGFEINLSVYDRREIEDSIFMKSLHVVQQQKYFIWPV